MTGPTREKVECTWPSCGHTARGQCNSHQLTGLRPGNHTVDLLVAENAALREKLEAAEAQLTEARAREAAAWMAGRDAAADRVDRAGHCLASELRYLTPPSDHTAALNALLDAELDKIAAEADRRARICEAQCARLSGDDERAYEWNQWFGRESALSSLASYIRAIRRNPKDGV